MSLYNFLELPPDKLRYVFRLICTFDLACNKLAKELDSSTIAQVRQDQILEGFKLTQQFVSANKMGAIAQHLSQTQGKEFLELNSYSQKFISTYEFAVDSAKDWLVNVLEVPLWVLSQDIDEVAAALVSEASDEVVCGLFQNEDNSLMVVRSKEVLVA